VTSVATSVYRVAGPTGQMHMLHTPEAVLDYVRTYIWVDPSRRENDLARLQAGQAVTWTYGFMSVECMPILQLQAIDELLAQAEGLQRQVEDLQGLRNTVLEPVVRSYKQLTPEQLARLHTLPDVRIPVPLEQ